MKDLKQSIADDKKATEEKHADLVKKRNDLLNQGKVIQTQINELNVTLLRLEGKYQALTELSS